MTDWIKTIELALNDCRLDSVKFNREDLEELKEHLERQKSLIAILKEGYVTLDEIGNYKVKERK